MTKEEILKNKPSTKIGLDDYYGRQTTLNAMQEYAEAYHKERVGADYKQVEFGARIFRNVKMAAKVELILKPEYMNSVFTWKQIQDAIMDDINTSDTTPPSND